MNLCLMTSVLSVIQQERTWTEVEKEEFAGEGMRWCLWEMGEFGHGDRLLGDNIMFLRQHNSQFNFF